jgi:hypothetical protein
VFPQESVAFRLGNSIQRKKGFGSVKAFISAEGVEKTYLLKEGF